ncbi:hypothetical protein OJ998_35865 [Solirubrobacter taibaiensis]|nr:hypothetical protein [Solirubrobacter taibaiensis]
MHDAPSFRRRWIAAALTTLALGAPAVAQADSIAYIKAGNVFLATTDGAREYQVTSDGGYSTVSQADNGRMVALRGDRIRHLERDGRVIADISTPVSTSTDPTTQFKGPFDPAISPDGTRVAYTYYWQYKTQGPHCMPPYCTLTRLYHGTGFTDPNRLTAWDEPGFRRRSGWIDASWVDNDTVLLSSPYILPNEDTVLWTPSAPDDSGLKRWFVDNAYYGKLNDVTMSRDRSALASIGNGGTVMNIANAVGGYHPDYPERCAQATVDVEGNKISSPTFAGDASKLFWAESADGIHVATLPKFTVKTECPAFTDGGKLLIAGATSPAWGPADVPAARPTPQDPGTKPGPSNPTTPVPGTPPPATAKLSVTKAKLAAALKQGLTLKLTGAKDGKHTVTAKYAKKTVAKGSVTVKRGAGKVTLKFTAAGKQQLKRKKTAKLAISGAGAALSYTLKK